MGLGGELYRRSPVDLLDSDDGSADCAERKANAGLLGLESIESNGR